MSEAQVREVEQPTAAFVLALLAGLWMLSAGGMMGAFGWGGMMGGRHRTSGWMWSRGTHAFGLSWPWFGVLGGILVIIGAVMLYARPKQRRRWGIVILVTSALDFLLGMGGLLAGILGVIGGALALSEKT